MRVEMKKKMQKKAEKYGSVLKACRRQETSKSSVVLIVFESLFVLFGLFMLFGVIFDSEDAGAWWKATAFFVGIGVILEIIRLVLQAVRAKDYLAFYQKQTGYSVEELQAADRELMGHAAAKFGEVLQGASRKPVLMYIVTDHYFLSLGTSSGTYLRKLEDVVAAFYSCQIPQGSMGMGEGLYLISRQEVYGKPKKNRITKKWCGRYGYSLVQLAGSWEKLCAEVLETMRARAPHIIPIQNIMANGVRYDLMSMDNWQEDWKRILGGY